MEDFPPPQFRHARGIFGTRPQARRREGEGGGGGGGEVPGGGGGRDGAGVKVRPRNAKSFRETNPNRRPAIVRCVLW